MMAKRNRNSGGNNLYLKHPFHDNIANGAATINMTTTSSANQNGYKQLKYDDTATLATTATLSTATAAAAAEEDVVTPTTGTTIGQEYQKTKSPNNITINNVSALLSANKSNFKKTSPSRTPINLGNNTDHQQQEIHNNNNGSNAPKIHQQLGSNQTYLPNQTSLTSLNNNPFQDSIPNISAVNVVNGGSGHYAANISSMASNLSFGGGVKNSTKLDYPRFDSLGQMQQQQPPLPSSLPQNQPSLILNYQAANNEPGLEYFEQKSTTTTPKQHVQLLKNSFDHLNNNGYDDDEKNCDLLYCYEDDVGGGNGISELLSSLALMCILSLLMAFLALFFIQKSCSLSSLLTVNQPNTLNHQHNHQEEKNLPLNHQNTVNNNVLRNRSTTNNNPFQQRLVSNSREYQRVNQISVSLSTLTIALDLCCLFVCCLQFLSIVKLIKTSFGRRRSLEFIKKTSYIRITSIGAFLVSIPIFFTGVILYTFVNFDEVTALITSIIIGIGIIFCGIASVQNVYLWQWEKTKASQEMQLILSQRRQSSLKNNHHHHHHRNHSKSQTTGLMNMHGTGVSGLANEQHLNNTTSTTTNATYPLELSTLV